MLVAALTTQLTLSQMHESLRSARELLAMDINAWGAPTRYLYKYFHHVCIFTCICEYTLEYACKAAGDHVASHNIDQISLLIRAQAPHTRSN